MASNRRLSNYLRSHRKRMGLSQKDVAFILGYLSGTKISRHERYLREPCLRTAFAYEALFQTPARELFAGIYEEVASDVESQARRLAQRLVGGPSPEPGRGNSPPLVDRM